MASETYKPVEVSAARDVAQAFAKDIVVIVSWDRTFNQVHTTTYGKSPADKAGAAKLGEILAKAAGCDLTLMTSFEDYRDRRAGEWAAERERLMEAIRDGIHGMSLSEVCSDEIEEIRTRLQAIVRPTGGAK